jgi:hypothetical protein
MKVLSTETISYISYFLFASNNNNNGIVKVRNAYKILLGKPECMRPLLRPEHRLDGRCALRVQIQYLL